MLDNMHFINTPGGKVAKGIVGKRNCRVELSTEQMEWLKKDLFRFGVSRVANSILSAVEQKTVSFF